jgi:RND family efflux transporter MFP subunit
MRRWTLQISMMGCLAAVIMVAAGCTRGKSAPESGAALPPSKVNIRRNVQISQAVQQSLVYTVETVGVIEAEGETQLAAGVAGNVDEVNFREGDEVDPADPKPMVKISVPLYEAAVEVAKFELERGKRRVDEAQENYDIARKNWSSLSRTEQLQREIALAVSKAEVSATKASLDRAEYNRRRSELRPPYKGRINKRFVTKGSYVDEKTVIATMADLSKLRLTTYIPETATSTVRELIERAKRDPQFDPEFSVLAFPKHTYRARIFYLSTVGETTTHQFECKAEIIQPPDAPKLLPGFTARVRIPLETKKDAILVHEECLRSTERGWLVFVPVARSGKDGKQEWLAKAIRVEPGYRAKGMVEIRSGLAGGEFIIRRGADALEEEGGTPIAMTKEEEAMLEKISKP